MAAENNNAYQKQESTFPFRATPLKFKKKSKSSQDFDLNSKVSMDELFNCDI
jgi:hypothetical protein